jgi:hypothetical protein
MLSGRVAPRGAAGSVFPEVKMKSLLSILALSGAFAALFAAAFARADAGVGVQPGRPAGGRRAHPSGALALAVARQACRPRTVGSAR